MDDFKSRLTNESIQLKDKLIKLNKFMESKDAENLGRYDRELLIMQERVMSEYHDILEERLSIL